MAIKTPPSHKTTKKTAPKSRLALTTPASAPKKARVTTGRARHQRPDPAPMDDDVKVAVVPPGEELLPEIYNLRATDGSFAQGLILPDEAFDNGFLELRFTDIPCDRRYRLDVEIIGVGTYEIFADLAYAELHAFAQTGGQQEG
mgnify:CR=1 FL=1